MASEDGHIGLDAHLLSLREDYRAAGVSRYIYQLLRHLPEEDPRLRYTAYLGFHCEDLPKAIRQEVASVPTWRPPVRILWEQLVAPLRAWQHGLDLWHALVNVQPILLPKAAVVTIQDLSFLAYPEGFRRGQRLYNRLFVRMSAHRARHVIVTSHYTKQDLVRRFHISPDKVTVTHLAMDEQFRPLPERATLEEFRRRKGLPEHFVLYLGTIEPRKNLIRLIQAYAMLKRKGLPHHLVIGGGKGWLYDKIYAAAQESGVQDSVHFPGFIPQNEMVLWYNSADLFVYPSLFEGFGLPPLEAMACGVPVITSNVSSLPEIVGDGALTVNPLYVEEIAEAMHTLLTNREQRERWRQAGLKRASAFSWAHTARQTIGVYRMLLKAGEVRHV